MADEDGHRHRLVALLVLHVILPRVARIQKDARLVRALDLQPVETDVALPGIGILGHNESGAANRAAVAHAGDMHRQMREVELAFAEHHLLHRRVAHHFRLDQLAHAFGNLLHHRAFGGAEGQRDMADVGGRLPERAPAMRQVFEEHRLFARLIQQRTHLGQRIDRLVDPDQLAGRFQVGNPGPHGLGLRGSL